MTLTIESVAAELGPLEDDAPMSEVCKAIAHGSLMGARGNSGVILSQMLRGLVAKFPPNGDVSAGPVGRIPRERGRPRPPGGRAHRRRDDALDRARRPPRGPARTDETLIELVRSARDRAKVALAFTPDQLAVLKQAGVVDSGGTGLVLLYDALCNVVAHDVRCRSPPDGRDDHRARARRDRVAESTIADLALRGDVPPRRRGRQDARLSRSVGGAR
jgi:dihydroxyacetone kinase-like predicted kinase